MWGDDCVVPGKLTVVRETLQANWLWLGATAASWLGIDGLRRTNRTAADLGKPRHLLLIAWHFPPSVDAGVHRPTALVRYAPDCDWRITVISGPVSPNPEPSGLSLLENLPKEQRLIRVRHPGLSPNSHLFPRIDGGFLNALATFVEARHALKGDPPDLVMATGPPFQSFAAACYLARSFRVGLVLDYRDEWTQSPFPFVESGTFDRIWENACLGKASAVFFTTESQRDHGLRTFGQLNPDKCRVIPNGWEPRDIELFDDQQPSRSAGDVLMLSYVGSLGEHVPIQRFLVVLEQVLKERPTLMDKLRVQFIGKKSGSATTALSKFRYPEVLRSLDHMPKPQASQMMRQSSALLLINDSSFERYLPGKLYDYLAARRPILVWGEKRGEISQLVSELSAGQVVPMDDPKALTEALERFECEKGQLFCNPKLSPWLAEHTRQAMALKMIEALDRCFN